VVKVCNCTTATGPIRNSFEFGGRDVSDKYLGMARWLSADILWDVANGEIDGICSLSTEKRQLRLCYGRSTVVSDLDGLGFVLNV
jgi:hypothetical protein